MVRAQDLWQHFEGQAACEGSPVSDTSDHDQTRFVRSPAAAAGNDGNAQTAGRAPLETVDFDVTAGFGDEAAAGDAEFIDLTQGADSPAAGSDGDFLDLGGAVEDVPLAPAPTAAPPPVAPAPAPTPAPVAETAGGGGKLVLIGAIVVALVAAVLWYVLR